MEKQLRTRFALVLIVAAALGCGGGPEADVTGRVTLNGNAVGPGTIVFASVSAGDNPATGTIQVDGRYFLKSNRERGLRAGRYKVSVTVFDQPIVPAGQRSTAPVKLVTPEKYADPSTSGLEYDVAAGKNTIDVVLTSK
jgi:hypothetical protein